MNLAPREIDKLIVYQVADLARKRMARGTKLNYSEAVALVTEAILEGARDGKSVSDCMEIGTKVKPNGLLVSVSSMRCRTSTPDLSTS